MYFRKGTKAFRDNINNGLLLLFNRKLPQNNFCISFDQSVLLVFFYMVVTFLGSLYLSLPKPEFNAYGLVSVATHIFFILLGIYLISKLTKKADIKLSLFVVLLSVWPWLFLAWLIIGQNTNFDYWNFYGKKKYLYILYNLWLLWVFIRAISCVIKIKRKELVLILSIFLVFISIPLHYLNGGDFWYKAYEESDEYEKYRQINLENTYYKQFSFIEDFKLSILPERKNISDLYFVGFGGDATQDVFMKEVQYARELFDEKFSTKGRSVALINNTKTLDNLPIASKSNLDLVIQHIGNLINPEEDILFLYLTSHGSKQEKMSVKFTPLGLNSIIPKDLVESLDLSGIKYKILIVSACYSGVFIEPLKDDYTIIMTAAASQNESFGCSNESNFTYLGRAIFEEQLSHNFIFIDSFYNAIESIDKREKMENLDPSEPQLFVGDKIRAKLEIVTKQLENSNKLGSNVDYAKSSNNNLY